ncbi:MAG: hypothetical protein WC333_00095 [Dehalococcoidia bacterium]|jgi:hypothetical protein
MWNWKKITNDLNKLPPFGKPIVLYWKDKDKKKHAMIGCLKSVDAEGIHWGTSDTIITLFDLFNIVTDKELKPTHYCEIETPEDDIESPLSPDQD